MEHIFPWKLLLKIFTRYKLFQMFFAPILKTFRKFYKIKKIEIFSSLEHDLKQ